MSSQATVDHQRSRCLPEMSLPQYFCCNHSLSGNSPWEARPLHKCYHGCQSTGAVGGLTRGCDPNLPTWGVWALGTQAVLRLGCCLHPLIIIIVEERTKRHPILSPGFHTYFSCPNCMTVAPPPADQSQFLPSGVSSSSHLLISGHMESTLLWWQSQCVCSSIDPHFPPYKRARL